MIFSSLVLSGLLLLQLELYMKLQILLNLLQHRSSNSKNRPFAPRPPNFPHFPYNPSPNRPFKKKTAENKCIHICSQRFSHIYHIQNQTQLFILCCSYSSNYCTYSPHHYHAAQLLANSLKLLSQFCLRHASSLSHHNLFQLNKKKVWQLPLATFIA